MNPNETNESSVIYSLDDLLFSLDCILCSLSLWIFSRRKFSDSIYWYFRIITIANIAQLTFAIPYGVCYTPKYFPSMDSYACVILQCAYITFEYFTAHFVAILEIAVLLERIKIMNSFVKKRFTISSKKMILITFLPCLLFNSIFGLSYAPYFGGEFYYFDSNGAKRVNSFWYLDSSTLAASEIGSIFMIAFAFIRDVLTLITTIILNIVSLFELKNYLKIRSLLIGRQNAIGPSQFDVTTNSNSTRISNAQNQAQKSKMKNNI